MATLSTKHAREKLAVRVEPYWQKLGIGAYLGLRRGELGDSWRARYRTRDGKQNYAVLEDASDFDSAKLAAEKWFAQLSGSGVKTVRGGTVRDALDAYLTYLENQGRADTAKAARTAFGTVAFKDPIAKLTFAKITREDVNAWRERVRLGRDGKGIEPRTVNRYVGGVRAGVRRAMKEGFTGNAAAWAVDPLADDIDSGGTTETAVFLTPEHRAAIIANAGPAAAALFRAMEATGARPKELAAATVGDFDKAHGTVILRHRKGRPARVRLRTVVLDVGGLAVFTAQAKSKLPGALLFPRPDGERWTRWDWADEFNAAVKKHHDTLRPAQKAQRIPDDARPYSFRHSRISELLQRHGIDPVTVAEQTGTSVRMIEKAYFKFIAGPMRERLRAIGS
jgi:integrase